MGGTAVEPVLTLTEPLVETVVTPAELEVLAALREVQQSGWGEVRVTVQRGRLEMVFPTFARKLVASAF